MVWYLLRTIEHSAKSQEGKAAQIFTASNQLFSHLSHVCQIHCMGCWYARKNMQLYCLSNINLKSHKKKKSRRSGLKNHLNAKCKTHSCLIPLPPLGCFRTSSPDVGKVFCISKTKKESVLSVLRNWID